MPTLPIGTVLPALGDHVDVEFDPGPEDSFGAGATFAGEVTSIRVRSFTVWFAVDGTSASVHVAKHRYRVRPSKKRRRADAAEHGTEQTPAAPATPAAKRGGEKRRSAAAAKRDTAETPAAAAAPAAERGGGGQASSSGKSDYERAREQKIAANEAMLRQLGLIGVGSVAQTLQQAARAKPRAPRPRVARTPAGELRRSGRDRTSTGKSDLIPLDVDDTPRKRRAFQPVDAAAIDAAEQTAGASTGETFTKVMTPSMVEYSYKFGIGAAGASVLPVYGSSPGGSRKMICWLVADEDSFGDAAVGSEGMEWPAVYHDHSKNFDGGWQGFAKAHGLRTGDVCVFERLRDKFEPARDSGGFTNSDLSRGWVTLRVILHRGSA
jgi:hypothetical protein